MENFKRFSGVYCAVVTPLTSDFRVDTQAMAGLLEFISDRGCHGALLLGTTGEGPSFAPNERLEVLQAAMKFRASRKDFTILAGTGTPSLEETILLTQAAFEKGVDGVVVLPPYYFRKVTDDGLFRWFSQIIQQATPPGKALFGYHIPSLTGIPFSIELLSRLKETYPTQFAGIKDSSADPEQARLLGTTFKDGLIVFTGNDRLFSLAVNHHASGCITALANLCSPDLRRVWNAHLQDQPAPHAQERLDAARGIMENYPPFPSFVKAMLSHFFKFPIWQVRPPLLSLSQNALQNAIMAMDELCESSE